MKPTIRMSVDGGPAFPKPIGQATYADGSQETSAEEIGMSLRDWFAGIAMQGILQADPNLIEISTEEKTKGIETLGAVVVTRAYRYADAMLEEREKE